MPKVSEEHRAHVSEHIHQAALRVFARKGLRSTTMSDIIKESGMSTGAIYSYFANKEALTMSVASAVVGGRLHVLEELTATDPLPRPAVALRQLLSGVDPVLFHGGLILQVWSEASTHPGMAALARDMLTQVRTGITTYLTSFYAAQGLPADAAAARAVAAAPAVLGLGQGLIVQSTVFEDFDPDSYLRAVDVLLDPDHA
ncbi:HTH-type transcriptional regulator BetI [Austwickia sp. TVS 96-490-7B]|uniref:TetR/AcrR family transcriptional regulator n=1 Tax=Austwickia sp. TVS 96-490-7B TaxID=2830843 RepID=UPI001C56E20B|nr:TetR/AcrR family transcriptional regulator [Austwickia sp. TVS 96-490-7B]MBW3085069.1 HTH-type transcriptional regulator BetI [Austwickia sp. TVS 96-490-7B]